MSLRDRPAPRKGPAERVRAGASSAADTLVLAARPRLEWLAVKLRARARRLEREAVRGRRSLADSLREPGLPSRLAWSVLAACLLPSFLALVGVDIGLADGAGAAASGTYQALLAGSFTHLVLEWTSVCVALATAGFAVALHRLTKSSLPIVVGLSVACGALLDAFHVFAAEGLLGIASDPDRVASFTWSASRLFHVGILVVGLAVFVMRSSTRPVESRLVVIAAGACLLASLGMVLYWLERPTFPRMTFPDAWINRPYEIPPLLLLLAAWPLVFRPFQRKVPGWFSHAVVLSLMPEIATQLHMAFSSSLHDANYVAAHLMKLVAYAVPLVGLAGDHARSQREAAARESDDRYLSMTETATDAIISIDVESRMLFVNDAASRIFGHARKDMLGQPLTMLMPPALRERHRAGLQRYLLSGERTLSWEAVELPGLRADGTTIPLELSFGEIRRPGRRLFTGIVRDVSERKRQDAALRESEERYALAIAGAHDGIWDWNLVRGDVFYSERWKLMLGLAEADVGNSPDEWFGRVHPEDKPRLEAALHAHLEGDSPHFSNEHRMRHASGHWRWMLARGLTIRGERGRATRVAGSLTDVTERRDAEQRLLHEAFHDPLTGLPNRTFFMDQLRRSLARSRRGSGRPFAVLFMDLDRFKVVNDSLGHAAGDQLLLAVAQRIESCLDDGDLAARLGGDEFAVLLDDVSGVADAVEVAQRIQAAVQEPVIAEGKEVRTALSIGIAISAEGHERAEELLRDADTAMYRAKALGKARHAVFETDTVAETLATLEAEALRAIERNELRVHYLPTFDLASGRLAGAEALLRWEHPVRGLLAPADFLPLAEETGALLPMGRWLLGRACRDAASWQGRPALDGAPAFVGVNLSRSQITHPALPGLLGTALREAGLPANCVRLELAESLLLDDSAAIAALRELEKLGVQVQVDDFGTRSTTLAALRQLPLDAVKIDRSFVTRLAEDVRARQVVRRLVIHAYDAGFRVAAEGVETAEQLALLRELGCQEAQGFLLSPPLDAGSLAVLLDSDRRV